MDKRFCLGDTGSTRPTSALTPNFLRENKVRQALSPPKQDPVRTKLSLPGRCGCTPFTPRPTSQPLRSRPSSRVLRQPSRPFESSEPRVDVPGEAPFGGSKGQGFHTSVTLK